MFKVLFWLLGLMMCIMCFPFALIIFIVFAGAKKR